MGKEKEGMERGREKGKGRGEREGEGLFLPWSVEDIDVKQESCAIANMTARCADKSKQTATPPPKITRLSADSVQPDVMDVGVERTFSYQNFSVFPWE